MDVMGPCPNCGCCVEVVSDKFCPYCGTRLRKQVYVEKKVCKNCGSEAGSVPSDPSFCVKCGHPFKDHKPFWKFWRQSMICPICNTDSAEEFYWMLMNKFGGVGPVELLH